MVHPLSAAPLVFRLFRTPPPPAQADAPDPCDSELRGTTLEGYHFAIRVERSSNGRAQRLIGWHGSSQGGARVDLQRNAEGLWRDGQGRLAASVDELLAPSLLRSAAWAAQWSEVLPDEAPSDTDEPAAAMQVGEPS